MRRSVPSDPRRARPDLSSRIAPAAAALGCLVAAAHRPALAVDPAGPPDPAAIYAPFAALYPPNAFRSASGVPGPAYWQNRADTTIAASIDPATHVLHGDERIAYTNRSPDPLDVVWVQLDQNLYRPDSRAGFLHQTRVAYADRDRATGGDVLERVAVAEGGAEALAPVIVSDTRMQVRLPHPLAPHGGTLVLHIAWHHTVPGAWGGRTAVTRTASGDLYEMGQWFPRMAVYDDLRGWDTAPYLGQEFYLEYGDIDYRVTVPRGWLVVGSGALLNPDEVLSPTERARLARAASSETAVPIRTPAEVGAPGAGGPAGGTRTWHWRMQNTRDVAFVASPALAWDAARLDLPPVSPAPGAPPVRPLAMSVYPPDAAARWRRSTEFVKHAIEYFSSTWFAYPYPNAINVGGHGAGMEYPGMAFDDAADTGLPLFWITTHEFGHNWFPMVVGSDERRYAFMDEGFNTFIDVYASDHFNHGEFAPKRDPEYAAGGGRPADEILPTLRDPDAPALLAPSDLVTERYRHAVTYFKGAFGLVLLRERILGPDRFDPAFRRYIAAWAYRHPDPDDFFRAMSSEAGEDLSWFWRGWYERNWLPGVAIASASYRDHDPTHGLAVALRDTGWLAMPFDLVATAPDGTATTVRVPSEFWMQGDARTVVLPTRGPVARVAVDPDHDLPLADRTATVATPAP